MIQLFLYLSLVATRFARFFKRHKGITHAVAAIVAFGLGLWGWSIVSPPADLNGWLEALFRTMQLITLQFPSEFDRELPWQLHVARLAVPIVAAAATINVVIGSITRPVRLALLPHVSDHIILTGLDRLGDETLFHLSERGNKVVAIERQIETARVEYLESFGVTVLEGDPATTHTWKAANVSKAAAVILAHDEDRDNLNMAVQAINAVGNRSSEAPLLHLIAVIRNNQLTRELDFGLDHLSRAQRIRPHRVSVDREGIRLVLKRVLPRCVRQTLDNESRAMVVGLAGDWRQILLQLIVSLQDHPTREPKISLCLNVAERDAFESWRTANPDAALVARFEIHEMDEELESDRGILGALHEAGAEPHIVLVLKEEVAAIIAALRLRRESSALGISPPPYLIFTKEESRLLEQLGKVSSADLDLSRLVPFGGILQIETLERILNRKGDAPAIALHEAYRQNKTDHTSANVAALQAWDELPENLRDANRAAVAHAEILLASLGLSVESLVIENGLPVLSQEQLDCAARIEHRRWCADRIERGWRSGPVRNDMMRIHPSLRPYDALSKAEQEKDVVAVLNVLAAYANAKDSLVPPAKA